MNNQIKQKLIKIAKKYDLELLILFGSRADKTSNNNSDWDLAYLSYKKIDKIKLINEVELFLVNVDLIDLFDNISFFLKKEIFEGILIYEKEEGLFEEKKIDLEFELEDEKEYLQEYIKYLENNLKIK